ncbi:aminotransferase class I/II-fold pyridoxal phosphate-dependent enzyme [Pontibacter ruber]|uniref:Aminotransferase class I/II-fold pyridoxal phosphate-dependent enzyme n=1 Tax=Pontibacter ruber TaxID=1343895 RepID=A0ABW5D2C6_9BACT|nr:aminotransferase class I/II-fold pyridoxal phosphate-dependent enzyme [Pontibacter ruber]
MSDPNQVVYTDRLPGRSLVLDGVEHLFCSGTSYLGIACNKQFRQYLVEGFCYYGTNYSSSRNSNLQLQVFEEAENYLAAYTGAEAALTMSSGYLAGQTLAHSLQGSGRFIYAPGTHPALWRSPADAPHPSHDYDAWVAWLLQETPVMPEKHLVIVTNSLDPLQARKYNFSWVSALPQNKQITLIVDDSHGFGVTGQDGAGIYGQLGHLQQVRLVVISSMGKALGIPAGIILGDQQLINRLRASSFFGGASPAIPAYLYAFLRSEEVFAEARRQLFHNISFFRQRLDRPELFRSFADYPVFSTDEQGLYTYLLEHGIIISSFRYPTPSDEPITRVILSSLHTSEDLERLALLINNYKH